MKIANDFLNYPPVAKLGAITLFSGVNIISFIHQNKDWRSVGIIFVVAGGFIMVTHRIRLKEKSLLAVVSIALLFPIILRLFIK